MTNQRDRLRRAVGLHTGVRRDAGVPPGSRALLLACSLATAGLAAAYALRSPRLIGERADRSLAPLAWLVFWPSPIRGATKSRGGEPLVGANSASSAAPSASRCLPFSGCCFLPIDLS